MLGLSRAVDEARKGQSDLPRVRVCLFSTSAAFPLPHHFIMAHRVDNIYGVAFV